ncbi:MAG: aspartyl protease family protein [Candidatus Eisenbacteria bacterium]|nr:aspartyl protease family protein [Candidatus Eisenbacteria bacterium]
MPRFSFRRWSLLALLALACPRAATATITPDAEKVVARYVSETGGAAAFAAERSLYTHAKVSGFGFSGWIETWSERPDRHFARTELGPFKLSEGAEGGKAWRTDPTTGKVVPLADRDLLESRVSTWFELERWAEPDQGGGSVTLSSRERDSTGAYTVLSVKAPDSGDLKPRRLWFSDATGLLARIETARDHQWMSTTLDGWRQMAGRRRATISETGISGMPANRLRSEADSMAANASTAGVAFTAPELAPAAGLRWLGVNGFVSLPFEYSARHVWLRASVNGAEPRDFLFDTGATLTVLDSTYAASIGVKTEGFMQAQGAGAAGSASFAKLASLTVKNAAGEGVEMTDVKVGVLSVAPAFAPVFWRSMAGVLGYDFISRFVLTVDYDKGVIELNDPGMFRYKGTEPPVPMVMNGVVPGVTASFGPGTEGVFRVDVGSSSSVDVHAPFAAAHALEDSLREARDVAGTGFGGQFVTRLGRLRTMTLGPYSWNDAMVTISRATEGAFASEEFAGNIGNRVLERFRMTLDYDGRRIWFEPGKRYPARDVFTRSGLMLARVDGRLEALSVLPGSPADRAGLREGDEVLVVDGRPASGWTLAQFDALLEQGADGRKVKFEVNRDGRRHKHTLTLRELMR